MFPPDNVAELRSSLTDSFEVAPVSSDTTTPGSSWGTWLFCELSVHSASPALGHPASADCPSVCVCVYMNPHYHYHYQTAPQKPLVCVCVYEPTLSLSDCTSKTPSVCVCVCVCI